MKLKGERNQIRKTLNPNLLRNHFGSSLFEKPKIKEKPYVGLWP
jgi:hypothetical protein